MDKVVCQYIRRVNDGLINDQDFKYRGHNMFPVERIVAQTGCSKNKKCSDDRLVLVEWKGFADPADYTWESLKHILGSGPPDEDTQQYMLYVRKMLHYLSQISKNPACFTKLAYDYIIENYNVKRKRDNQQSIQVKKKSGTAAQVIMSFNVYPRHVEILDTCLI